MTVCIGQRHNNDNKSHWRRLTIRSLISISFSIPIGTHSILNSHTKPKYGKRNRKFASSLNTVFNSRGYFDIPDQHTIAHKSFVSDKSLNFIYSCHCNTNLSSTFQSFNLPRVLFLLCMFFPFFSHFLSLARSLALSVVYVHVL